MSDTPRTNAAIGTKGPYKKEYFEKNMPVRFLAVCKLCEQLERELSAAQAALSRFEQAALPTEPERLTMTRELVSGGFATEMVVAAHKYDRLRDYDIAQKARADTIANETIERCVQLCLLERDKADKSEPHDTPVSTMNLDHLMGQGYMANLLAKKLLALKKEG